MSDTLRRVVELIRDGHVLISMHGYDEMAEDGILAEEAIEGAAAATVVEDYPEYGKDVVWGIPRGQVSPAVLVTAYRPDPTRWTEDFLRRR